MKKKYAKPECVFSSEVVQENLLLSTSDPSININVDDAPVSADDAAARQENNWDFDLTPVNWD